MGMAVVDPEQVCGVHWAWQWWIQSKFEGFIGHGSGGSRAGLRGSLGMAVVDPEQVCGVHSNLLNVLSPHYFIFM